MKLPLLCLLATWCAFAEHSFLGGEVTLAPLFQSHAVLQSGREIPIWGTAAPAEQITISFSGQVVSTTAGSDGRWSATLAALPASHQPRRMVIAGANTRHILEDILIGEVWICSGQSNMAWPVALAGDAAVEIAAADFPFIRHFTVEPATALIPATSVRGRWQVCSPENVGPLSAVAYYFARQVQLQLAVPVGVINSSVRGTPIEAWMSEESLLSDPAFAGAYQRWAEWYQAYPQHVATLNRERDLPISDGPQPPHRPIHRRMPSSLYNGMIAPLIPFGMRGMLWYQGEGNVAHAREYAGLFTAMINDWRARWGQNDFPFYFVQLANFEDGAAHGINWPHLREAQQTALMLPQTGMAVAIDIGNPHDIHPTNKQEVGRRLALIALRQSYGHADECFGPKLVSAVVRGNTMDLRFAHADGLHARDGEPTGFEIAGADRQFVPAEANIDGSRVLVSSSHVERPASTRYAWKNAPKANIYNSADLPMVPFRTDSW